ncbi:AsmA family protein [Thiolapillus sp.]|uniref:AsmA family protein n=3 Tax=Thiolapillus sp. TaxID=2017437 RepID=UPI0025FB6D8F|nr:AsmA family protein [Thiolapillus sp.]
MKIIKWFFGLVIGLVLLIVAAALIVPLFVDENMVKEKISSEFENRTGQTLGLNGPLNWSVFPWVGIGLSDVRVGSAQGFGEQPLAVIKELDVKVGVKPLFEKKIAVDTVVLKGVRLNLHKNKDGRVNWEGLAEAGETDRNKAEQPKAKTGGSSGMEGFEVRLKGIELEDVSLHFDDEQEGVSVRLDDLALKVGELLPGQPVPLHLGFRLENTQPVMKLDLSMSTDMTFTKDYQRIDLAALAVDLNAAGEGLPAQGVKLALAANVGLDNKQGALALSDLSVSGLNVDITGDLSVTDLHGKPRLEAKLALQQTNLKELLEIAGVEVVTADAGALTKVSGNLFVVQQGDTLTADPVSIKLDDSTLNGTLKILSFKGPVVRASFKLDAIDLDRYMPPKAEETAAVTKQPEKQKAGGGKPDFAALRKLNLDADFSVGSLTSSGLHMQNVILKLKSRKGVLTLDPISAALYEGKLHGSVKLDVRKDTPRFSVRKTLSGIQIEPLLKDLTGKAQLQGTGDIKVDVHSMGLDDVTIKQNLNGRFSLEFRDGAYIGFNLAQAIRQATGQAVSDEPQKTDFAELKGSGVIRQGVVTNNDFYMASPVLRVTGKGKVNLVKEKVNYLLTTKVVKSLQGQGGANDLKGVAIPVRISGNLNDPSFMVDLEAALKANAEHKIEEKKQELLDKAGESIEKKLGSGALKGLFGR